MGANMQIAQATLARCFPEARLLELGRGHDALHASAATSKPTSWLWLRQLPRLVEAGGLPATVSEPARSSFKRATH